MADIGFIGAFVAGIVSFVSPCVLPIVPPSLAFIAGVGFDQLTAEGEGAARRRVVMATIAFVLGFTTIFVLLGATASTIGQLLQAYRETLAIIAGAVIILLGLHFLGVFRIMMLYREARVEVRNRPLGLPGAYVAGLAFAFGWTPCVGPILSTILVVAGARETALEGAGLLLVYALGIGIPFVLAAAFMGAFMGFMKKFRRHLGVMEKVIGLFLIIAGVLIMTDSMNVIGFWIQEKMPWLLEWT
jgi:cytochrome c-type biogenesis protein